jgi:hypothetical protein
MKRLLTTTLIIGGVVAVIVGALHASRSMEGVERVAGQLVSDHAAATRIVSNKWQYAFVVLIALGVAWLSLRTIPRWRSRLLIALLFVELFGLSWVCSLYRVFFQPAPCVLALVLVWAAAEGWSAFLRRDRSHLRRTFFADRLSRKEFARLGDAAPRFEPDPKTYEVSVVAFDIANKPVFAQDSDAVAFAESTAKFIRDTAAHLTNEGAYLQAADGEGVVGIFGFPVRSAEHADKATRVVIDVMKNSRIRQEDDDQNSTNRDLRAGVSSGVIVAGAVKESERPLLLTRGEPIDLARRFCALNHFYGSKALMDTRTFDQVSATIVARPIDFISGMNSHDRLEVYEPLWLAAEATPEHIARRDSFWSGVVLYREKRWAEAYNEFQKARDSETEEDAALQFYLRRLEPLLLQLPQPPLE